MIKWDSKKLDELGFVGRGKSKHRPRDASFLYGGKYPFIQTGDVKNANLYVNSYTQTYSDAGLAQSKLWNKGTLCITIAANIAETAILDIEACFPDSIIGFVADETVADAKFIKYYIDTFKQSLKQISQGAAQDNLNLKKLLSFEFKVPDIDTQNRIVKVLSSYDDLIENNIRRIKLLEESAELIYKEWFINLRFPGYEKCNIEEGMPEGWIKVSVNNILAKHKRKTKVKKEVYLENGNTPVIDQSRSFIGGYTNDEDAVEENIPAIIFGDHTRIVKYIDFKFASGADGTQLIYSNSEKISQEYLYFAIKNIDLSDYAYARHFKYLKQEEIYIPSEKIMKQFTKISKNILTQVSILRNQNEKLKEARDIFIPRLISGEIEV
jgi:type I restriction enzyme S subunit